LIFSSPPAAGATIDADDLMFFGFLLSFRRIFARCLFCRPPISTSFFSLFDISCRFHATASFHFIFLSSSPHYTFLSMIAGSLSDIDSVFADIDYFHLLSHPPCLRQMPRQDTISIFHCSPFSPRRHFRLLLRRARRKTRDDLSQRHAAR
jgi:hypothetical protein